MLDSLFAQANLLGEMLSFTFIQRALLVGLFVSLCAAILGVSLVLKRYAMIATGLSHVGFASMVITGALNISPLVLTLPFATLVIGAPANPLWVSVPVVLAAAFALLRIRQDSRINGDSAVAIISTASLAIGIIVVSLTTGLNTDICDAMFGAIIAVTRADMLMGIGLSVAVLLLFVLFYKQIFAVTFDEDFSRATGVRVKLYTTILALLTAVTVVVGMRLVGAMLIASLTVFPALTAMRLFKRFLSVVIASAVLSLLCFFFGMMVSLLWNLPPGASIVAVNLLAFLIFSIIGFFNKKRKKELA